MSEVGIAGAGFSGAVVARQLAEAGHRVTVFDPRDHVAGNSHTARDPATGVLVHAYGPHIFHTAHEHVWRYVTHFGEFRPYQHRVRATVGGRVYPLPVNLATINQFFGAAMTPSEARAFLADRAQVRDEIVSFEDQALAEVGPELYEAFFRHYTRKQWGVDPSALPASVWRRLPVRFTYDDRYFDHPYQALPVAGYTPIVEAILDHPAIDVRLSAALTPDAGFDHVVWTGPLDGYFGGELGRLGYRTIDFDWTSHDGDQQGCAVMNHGDADVPYTRVTEYGHLAPWEQHERSVTSSERSRAAGPDDIPYYPIRLVEEQAVLRAYVERARTARGVTFVGRLGTYRYLDMDVCIHEALAAGTAIATALTAGDPPPVFTVTP